MRLHALWNVWTPSVFRLPAIASAWHPSLSHSFMNESSHVTPIKTPPFVIVFVFVLVLLDLVPFEVLSFVVLKYHARST